jgi:hypothetical protein
MNIHLAVYEKQVIEFSLYNGTENIGEFFFTTNKIFIAAFNDMEVVDASCIERFTKGKGLFACKSLH